MPNDSQPGNDLIFGRNTVLAFLTRAGEGNGAATVHKIFFAEGLRSDHRTEAIKHLAKEQGVPVMVAERRKLDRMAEQSANEEVGHHQGVVAQISQIELLELNQLTEHLASRKKVTQPLLVLLDGIEDPHNLGAVIRVCEACGVEALLLPTRRSAGVTAAVAKTSAGALAFLTVVRIHNSVRAIEELKKQGFWIVGMAGDAPQKHFEADLVRPTVLVLGNEGHGISRLVAEHCDFLLRIPMLGRTESLNVSVAAGIILSEFVRQNMKKPHISKDKH